MEAILKGPILLNLFLICTPILGVGVADEQLKRNATKKKNFLKRGKWKTFWKIETAEV